MSAWSVRRFEIHERMDEPEVDAALLESALRFIRRINHLLGYTRATIGHLDRLTRDFRRDRTLRILDVATGSADVPEAILRWADRRRMKVEIVGLDLHAATLAYAARVADPRIALVRGDATRLPFEDGSFDIAMTSMFLHHLPDDVAADALREMGRVASLGVIAADLERSRFAYGWISLFTLFADPLVRHDARVSVRQAFTIPEMEKLRRVAGLDFARVHGHFGYRFVLAGRRDASA